MKSEDNKIFEWIKGKYNNRVDENVISVILDIGMLMGNARPGILLQDDAGSNDFNNDDISILSELGYKAKLNDKAGILIIKENAPEKQHYQFDKFSMKKEDFQIQWGKILGYFESFNIGRIIAVTKDTKYKPLFGRGDIYFNIQYNETIYNDICGCGQLFLLRNFDKIQKKFIRFIKNIKNKIVLPSNIKLLNIELKIYKLNRPYPNILLYQKTLNIIEKTSGNKRKRE